MKSIEERKLILSKNLKNLAKAKERRTRLLSEMKPMPVVAKRVETPDIHISRAYQNIEDLQRSLKNSGQIKNERKSVRNTQIKLKKERRKKYKVNDVNMEEGKRKDLENSSENKSEEKRINIAKYDDVDNTFKKEKSEEISLENKLKLNRKMTVKENKSSESPHREIPVIKKRKSPEEKPVKTIKTDIEDKIEPERIKKENREERKKSNHKPLLECKKNISDGKECKKKPKTFQEGEITLNKIETFNKIKDMVEAEKNAEEGGYATLVEQIKKVEEHLKDLEDQFQHFKNFIKKYE